jgi:hypothetical protein
MSKKYITKYLEIKKVYIIMARCKNGTRKNKQGVCVEKTSANKRCKNGTRKNKQGVCVEKKTSANKRCKNGTRKNKQGVCVEKIAITKPGVIRSRMFRYHKSYELDEDYKNLKFVESVRFDIGRYNEISEIIKFQKAVSIKDAIKKVEEYLSQPLTKEYFNKVKSDTQYDDSSWDDVKDDLKIRGDIVAYYLEDIEIDNSEIILITGS